MMLTLTCEHCGAIYQRARGDQGRGRFCCIVHARTAQRMATPEERFRTRMATVAKSDGCWEWPGTRRADGYAYGHLRSGPRGAVRQLGAHRVAWAIAHGPIPDGLDVLHRCDNPPCVKTEPDERFPDGHLFLGTQGDNNRDRDAKGRQRSLRGDEHPQRLDPSKVLRGERSGNAKITETDVRDIRSRRAAGERLTSIAAAYGITMGQVSAIATRRNWAHVV